MTDDAMISRMKYLAGVEFEGTAAGVATETLRLAAFRLEGFISWTAEWEAIRQTVPCPTCLGSRSERMTQELCPDCTDGKIPMARLLKVGVDSLLGPSICSAHQQRVSGCPRCYTGVVFDHPDKEQR